MTTTKSHVKINRQVMTQPIMAIGVESKALEMANVDVARAVFGKIKENQFIAKVMFPRTQL